MIKLLGTGLTIFACIALSQKKIRTYKASVKALNSLISALKEMSDSISFYKKPLPEIVGSLKNHKDDVFFKRVFYHLSSSENETITNAWEKALEEDMPLLNEVKEALASLGKNLGKQPAEQEKENISFCLRELEDILKSTEELSRKNAKMIQSFGILSGLLIVILFM